MISRSKVNRTMKFGQFIEYNMKNIFNEKLSNGGEASPRNFHKKSKPHTSLDQQTKMS